MKLEKKLQKGENRMKNRKVYPEEYKAQLCEKYLSTNKKMEEIRLTTSVKSWEFKRLT
jgi:hypothetical protein